MIVHVIMFKLNDRSPENAQRAKDAFLSMQGNVPQLRHLEVGIDALHSERSYDLVMTAHFDSWDDLQAYQQDPFHNALRNSLKSHFAAMVTVDYES
ncbi:MAG: Dabb family protein [Anaerolineae bacterium]